MASFIQVMLSLFAASTVIIFVYALLCLISVGISLSMIFKGRKEFSRGHMRRFINSLSVTLAVSFLYAVWNILNRLKLIDFESDILANLIDNVILVIFIMLLTYVAFLTREISKRFGFRTIGNKVSKSAKRK